MALDIRFFCLKFFVLACCILISNNLTIEEKGNLIKSVSQNLFSQCVIIIKESSGIKNDDIVLAKYLSQSLNSYIAIWDINNIIEELNLEKKIVHPKQLIVINMNDFILNKLEMILIKTTMALYNWLVFSNSGKAIDQEFQKVVIPINCIFIVCTTKDGNLVELNEIYNINLKKISELQIKLLGYWDMKKGLRVYYNPSINDKMDLKGESFIFCLYNFTTMDPCLAKYIDDGEHFLQCNYFKFWKLLERMLNFSTEYRICDNFFEEGNSSGPTIPMLEMIKNGSIDTGGEGYAFTSDRLLSISYLWPVFRSQIILVGRLPRRRMDTSSFMKPFNLNIWYALLAWILTSSTVTNVIQYLINKKKGKKKRFTISTYIENAFAPVSALCLQSSPSPLNKKMRVAYFMIYIIPLIFFPSYSGCLISSLYLPSEIKYVNTLKELEDDGSYKLGTINNTYLQTVVDSDKKFINFRKKNLILVNKPLTFEESFKALCSEKIIMAFESPIITTSSLSCESYVLHDESQAIFNSLAVRKNFSYYDLFNRKIALILSSGLHEHLAKLVAFNFFKAREITFSHLHVKFKSFSLEEVLPIFGILAIGILCSLMALMVEMIHAKKKKQRVVGISREKMNVHSDKELDTTNAERGVWLVKVPKYVATKWEKAPGNIEVGKLKICKQPGQKMQVELSLSDAVLNLKEHGEENIPKDHKLDVLPVKHLTLGVFSHTAASNLDGVVPESEKLALEGRIAQKLECRPYADNTYMKLKLETIRKASLPVRQVKQLDRVVQNYKPISDHKNNILYSEKKKNEGKKARDDKEAVLNMLFAAFEKHQYYNIRDLVKITNQPIVYLKEILSEVCNYNIKNPHKNMWELKPEYRHYKETEENNE